MRSSPDVALTIYCHATRAHAQSMPPEEQVQLWTKEERLVVLKACVAEGLLTELEDDDLKSVSLCIKCMLP
jgi:hypothetical protein